LQANLLLPAFCVALDAVSWNEEHCVEVFSVSKKLALIGETRNLIQERPESRPMMGR